MQKIISVFILTLSFSLSAQTLHSEMVSYVQRNYADTFQDYPILIFDIDELEKRFLMADAFGDEDEKEKKRSGIIAEYVKEKTGVELSFQESSSIEPYAAILKNSAYAVPIKESYGSKTISFCAVFPASPNANQRLEVERLMAYQSSPKNYENADFFHLKEKMTFQEMQYFSMFHEVAHCMDRTFFPAALSRYEPSAYDIHQSESFAESMALIFMEREGMSGTGLKRVWLRNLASNKMGPWYYENSHLAYGDILFQQFGAIYWLVPSLLGANEYVLEKSEETKVKSVDELLSVGIDLVNKLSYSHRSFHAVYQYQIKGDEVISLYEEWLEKSPEFFEDALKDLHGYIKLTNDLLNDSLLLAASQQEDANIVVDELVMSDLCDAYKQGDEAFWDKLQEWRSYLNGVQVNSNMTSQLKLQSDLNNVMSNLKSCGA